MKIWIITLLLFSCSSPQEPAELAKGNADVIRVEASGTAGAYTFSVTIASPDKGCEQYADWWEVLSEDGELIYRRILAHSHVNEQPFTRSGGAVNIQEDQIVWVRAHMNNSGYGGKIMKGSVQNGFEEAESAADLGTGVDQQAPLPSGCAF